MKNKVSIAKLQGSDGAKVLCYGLINRKKQRCQWSVDKCVMLKVWDKYVNWLKLVIINSRLKVEEVNLDFRSEQSE